jgi:hypothetical protein
MEPVSFIRAGAPRYNSTSPERRVRRISGSAAAVCSNAQATTRSDRPRRSAIARADRLPAGEFLVELLGIEQPEDLLGQLLLGAVDLPASTLAGLDQHQRDVGQIQPGLERLRGKAAG